MYDIFLSYATPDHKWATCVEQSLVKKGLNVFFDRLRLEAGKAWVPELRQALTDSKNLVAVWSEHANQSPWVQRELATFDALANDDASRRLILLNLEGSNRAYASVQAITDLGTGDIYAAGPEAVDPALWNRAMDRIERAVDADAQAVPIPVAVLTLRQQDLVNGSAITKHIASDLGITEEAVLERYGPTRLDWKPLGSTRTIREMLNDLREHLNQQVGGRRFRWDFEPESFWQPEVSEETKQFSRQFPLARLSVVIIDAVALTDPQVYRRLMLFQSCLTSEKTAIFVLPPFAADPRLSRLRDWLRKDGHPYFEPYYEPLQRPDVRVLAQCGFNIGDEEEMKRLLLVNMGQFLGKGPTTSKPEYLTVGSARR